MFRSLKKQGDPSIETALIPLGGRGQNDKKTGSLRDVIPDAIITAVQFVQWEAVHNSAKMSFALQPGAYLATARCDIQPDNIGPATGITIEAYPFLPRR